MIGPVVLLALLVGVVFVLAAPKILGTINSLWNNLVPFWKRVGGSMDFGWLLIILVLALLGEIGWYTWHEWTETPPTLEGTYRLWWKYWAVVVIFWGAGMSILTLLPYKFPKFKEGASLLKMIGTGVVLVVMFGIPSVLWVKDLGSSDGTSTRTARCLDVSARETRECTVNRVWTPWLQVDASERTTPGEMQICFTRGVLFERRELSGVTFFRFRVEDGTMQTQYRLILASTVCPNELPGPFHVAGIEP